MFIILFIFFLLSFIYTEDHPIQVYHLYRSINNARFKLHFQEKPDRHQNIRLKLVNNNTTLNLNTTSYFINILAPPYVSTWFATGGHIKKTIKHIGLTKNHQKTLERMWHTVNRCKEMELQYTGGNITKHFGQPYLKKKSDELNILADEVETILTCTTQPIWSTVISTTDILMQFVSPLSI